MKVFQNEMPFIHPLLFSEQKSAHIRPPTAMFLTELRERHSHGFTDMDDKKKCEPQKAARLWYVRVVYSSD